MGGNAFAWLLLLLLGFMLVIIGIQGSMGKVLAVAFTPGLLSVQDVTWSGGGPDATGSGQQPLIPGFIGPPVLF